MKSRKSAPKSPEERPLTRTSNSHESRNKQSAVWNSDTNSDDEISDDSTEEYDKTELLPDGTSSNGGNGLEKARIRTVAEGFKYRSLDEKLSKNDKPSDSSRHRPNKSWKNVQRYLLYGFVIVIIMLAIIVSVLLWLQFHYKHKLCDSQTCKDASTYITAKMNFSADPCDNFYNYVCGSWLKNLKVPKSRAKYNIFSVLSDENKANVKKIFHNSSIKLKGSKSTAVQKVKAYYNICMDEDTIESLSITPILQLIKDLGSWTVTTNQKEGVIWNKESWQFLPMLVNIHSYGSSPFFYYGVSADDKNSSVSIGTFDQSGLTLNSREEYFENHTDYTKTHDAYIEFAVKVAEYLGNSNLTDVKLKMEKVYQLEQQLAKIQVPKEELLDPEKTYHKMTLEDLQKLSGNVINWTEYISKLSNRSVQHTEEVLVYTPQYYKKIGAVIQNTESSVMANYFVWHLINVLVGYFPKRFVDAAMILEQAERGVTKLDPRWQRCISKCTSSFGYVTSALFVQDHFSEESRTKVLEIAREVRDAFIHNLPSVDWMDEQTRNKAIEKANTMDFRIGYPDWIMEQQKLDKFYENITVLNGEFLKTHLIIKKFFKKRNIEKLGKPPNPDEWGMKPLEVNAFYTPSFNYLAFMAGILHQPFYSPTFPISFNFGTTGMIAGHEMTHGFDNTGRHYDKFGNLDNWWSNKSAESFKKNSQCMVDQYSSYTAEGVHLKGERILGENIADNGGVDFAYSAYKNWSKNNNKEVTYSGMEKFTGDQLFYIGFGQLWCTYYTPTYAKQSILTDEHSISKFRTIGVVSNSKDFARAFKCKPGEPMNPHNKCKVW